MVGKNFDDDETSRPVYTYKLVFTAKRAKSSSYEQLLDCVENTVSYSSLET
jgi:hypothetical protein